MLQQHVSREKDHSLQTCVSWFICVLQSPVDPTLLTERDVGGFEDLPWPTSARNNRNNRKYLD